MSADLVRKIEAREALIGVIGLGYVGLPLVLRFGEVGFRIIGFDVDQAKIDRLNAGESYIGHISGERIQALRDGGRFEASADFDRLAEPDCILVCVPTPLTPRREPDLQYIESTTESLARTLRAGQLISLESTTYPGTTEEVLRKRFAECGLQPGTDYHLVYSPEREDPGNPGFSTQTIPKVVGGTTPACLAAGRALYGQIIDHVVPVSTTATAELVKLLENIYRSVNVALVNELKLLCDRMDIDIWEVIDAAATKPFGFTPFYPGPGLGGHCIPIDPFYLAWKAREYGFATRFIELAGEVNTAIPRFVVEKTAWALNESRKSLRGANILVLGVAYKKNVDDIRESPALEIMELFEEKGACLSYHDPFVARLAKTRKHDFSSLASRELTPELLSAQDAVIITTDHTKVDYPFVVEHAGLVIDTRNATRNVTSGRERIVRA